MLQEIENNFDITYLDDEAKNDDYIICFDKNMILVNEDLSFPKLKEITINGFLEFAFCIDKKKYYINMGVEEIKDNQKYIHINDLRTINNPLLLFAGITANHLYNWLLTNKYCGFCGNELIASHTEHAKICPNCKNTIYPRISPAVIVGIIDQDKLLLTKYADGIRNNYALVAGYCEVGESLEDTIKREVFEEVKLRVKNIRYFGNQPWGFSGSLLIGYFADLDGNNICDLSIGELKEATWFKKEDIEEPQNLISLTATMIKAFKDGKIK